MPMAYRARVKNSTAAPAGSKRWPGRVTEEGTKRDTTQMAASPTGRLTRKIDCQPNRPISRPPSGGPMAMPVDTVLPMMPSARPRSAEGITSAMMAVPSAWVKAAPSPCRARKAISQPTEGDSPHSSEAMVNSARPMMYRRFLSNISPSRAMTSSSEVTTSV